MTGEKAVLVVSFGTSFAKTREKTIDRIEADIASAFPGYRGYRAWTSRKIIAKLMERDKIQIPTVEEAMIRMRAEGIKEVIVQPTHLVNGIENERMKEDVLAWREGFKEISFGEPLLAAAEDQEQALRAVMGEFPDLKENEGLVFMGHGTPCRANAVYGTLDHMLKTLGYSRVFLGTVEAGPSVDTLLKKAKEHRLSKIFLAPFMVVAGDHAIHDMSGEDKDSWRSRFEEAGFTVECVMKGLGEYPGIRRMYVEHAKAAEAALESAGV